MRFWPNATRRKEILESIKALKLTTQRSEMVCTQLERSARKEQATMTRTLSLAEEALRILRSDR